MAGLIVGWQDRPAEFTWSLLLPASAADAGWPGAAGCLRPAHRLGHIPLQPLAGYRMSPSARSRHPGPRQPPTYRSAATRADSGCRP